MNTSLKDLKSSALQLKKEDRAELAKSLLESLGEDASILYEEEWMNVVRERKENYTAGKSGTTSWKEVKKRVGEENPE